MRGSNLDFPVRRKALFVELSSPGPPPLHPHPSIHPYPPFQTLPSLPSKARLDFSLNAIRNVTAPIHGQMEGPAVRLGTNTYAGE